MTDGVAPTVDELLEMVLADPRRAGDGARGRLAAGDYDDRRELARLHWVLGRVERETGQLDSSRFHLEEAMSLASDLGDVETLLGVHSSLAFTAARQGDLDGADKLITAAELLAGPVERARLLAQRGTNLYLRGELLHGSELVAAACEEMKRHGDLVHEARHRTNLGTALSDLGRYSAARRHLLRAVAVSEQLGLDGLVAVAQSRLGYVSTLRGDLPGALREFVAADQRLKRAGSRVDLPSLQTDHARALADAALWDDAEGMLAHAMRIVRSRGQLAELPGCLLRAAEVRLAKGDLVGAREAADEAATLFAGQGRQRWVALASNLALQARARSEGPSDVLTADLDRTAELLDECGWQAEALRTRLMLAKLHVESDRVDPRPLRPEVRAGVRRGRAADRVLLAYVDAVAAVRRGDRGGARRAITTGLRLSIQAQAGMGAMETRAHAAVHGFDLTRLGAQLAIADGRAMELLRRIEATRLMTSRLPMLRPPDDDVMASMLTELRRLDVLIGDVNTTTGDRIEAEQHRVRIERRVRQHSRSMRGDQTVGAHLNGELHEAINQLGDRQLLAHAVVDNRLYAVSISRRRARLHDLGSTEGIAGRIDHLAFALHRLSRTQGSEQSRESAGGLLRMVAAELAVQLVPVEVAASDEPLVIVPTALLHDVPWGVLAPFAGRTVSVSPSVTAWAKAHQASVARAAIHGGSRSVGLLAGPGLDHAPSEVDRLHGVYDQAAVLTGAEATVPSWLEILGRSDVVHMACHGSFRSDNPMFSSLDLVDGPLVVYDFERVSRLPEVVVLSACSSAHATVLQGGSILGLATALTTLGAASVIAPLTPISDASSVDVMCRLHQNMAAGSDPASALARAMAVQGDQPDWTGGSFIALGA